VLATRGSGDQQSFAAVTSPATGVPQRAAGSPSIAIVMPAFNEAARISGTLRALAARQDRTGNRISVYLADDGSTDGTTGVAWAAAEEIGLQLEILRLPHRGKALTVRDAMIAVSGRTAVDLLLMLDADNEISIEQLDDADWSPDPRTVYIARRVAEAHGELGATPSIVRRAMSGAMRLVARLLLGLPYSDTQCGFKLFPRTLAFELFSQQRSSGWVFDAEILVIARRSRLPIREIPVVWQPRGASRVGVASVPGSVLALLGIAFRRWTRQYKGVGSPRPA
jgi:glycosyltransferase involved in cell wall biosynthesis